MEIAVGLTIGSALGILYLSETQRVKEFFDKNQKKMNDNFISKPHFFREWSDVLHHPDIQNSNALLNECSVVETEGNLNETKRVLFDNKHIMGAVTNLYRDPLLLQS